jgi:AraC-like DNA-binding protein
MLMQTRAARELYLPGPGAPHWLPSGQPPGGLLYLGWGRRFYGRHPIPLRLHHGWTCMVVLSGQPEFLAARRRHRLRRGSVIVAGPDVPYGWTDQRAAASTHLVWTWAEAPVIGSRLTARTCWLRAADNDLLAEIEDLHRRTRREIQRADDFSPPSLQALKTLIDAALARCDRGSLDSGIRAQQRLQLAEQWMRRHLDIRAPAAALADYLGLSAMGLHRLFRESTGLSPGRAFLEIKMREAQRLLGREQTSVKETALALGYRHPGDFTRAYGRFYGQPPSQRALVHSRSTRP